MSAPPGPSRDIDNGITGTRPKAEIRRELADTSGYAEHSAESPTLCVTGSVYVDLTDVSDDKARMRVYRALRGTPNGARVVVHVGPLAVNPAVIPVVWEYGRHVTIEIQGHNYAVAHWIEALRDGLGVVV